MNCYRSIIILLGLFFFVNSSFAVANAVLANDFVYKNKIINPVCLEKFGVGDMMYGVQDGRTVDLDVCDKCAKGSCAAPKIRNDVYIEYGDADSGYIGYKFIGKYGNDIYVLNAYSGAGHGIFDMILMVKKNKNHLSLMQHVNGGDRCISGIKDAIITQNGMLLVTKYNSDSPMCNEKTKTETFSVDLKPLLKK